MVQSYVGSKQLSNVYPRWDVLIFDSEENIYFEEEIDKIENGHHVGENRKIKFGNVYSLV